MFYFDRKHPDVVFGDRRHETITVTDRSHGNESGQALGKAQQRYRFDKAREAAANAAENAETAARIRALQFRDLRAKAATDKRDDGTLDDAQGLLGHAQASMTERYTRVRKGKLVKPVR